MSKLNTMPTRMALAVGAAMLLAAAAASADPILTAGSTATANSLPGITASTSSPVYEGSSSFANDLAGVGSGYGFARDNGAYAVSASAAGIATGSSSASFKRTLTNTSGVAQHYSMSFHIYGGSISTNANGTVPLVAGESLLAQFAAAITVNGGTVFSTGASVMRDDVGTSGSKAGSFDLNPGDDATDGEFHWGGGWYDVDLGTFADGASIEVLALLGDSASSNVGTYTFDTGCCGYACQTANPVSKAAAGTDVVAPPGECTVTDFKGSARAFYGDPINFANSPNANGPAGGVNLNIIANAVPEPGGIALLGLALGAAGLAAGRRKRAA